MKILTQAHGVVEKPIKSQIHHKVNGNYHALALNVKLPTVKLKLLYTMQRFEGPLCLSNPSTQASKEAITRCPLNTEND